MRRNPQTPETVCNNFFASNSLFLARFWGLQQIFDKLLQTQK
jgi:hypothetical protein